MRARIEARRAALAALTQPLRPKSDAPKALCDQQTLDLIASFQYAVVGNLQRQTFAAAEPWARAASSSPAESLPTRELRRRFRPKPTAAACPSPSPHSPSRPTTPP
jgi:N6-L-threonylcarbamoyladenine synthase